jgi:hypothetical protein
VESLVVAAVRLFGKGRAWQDQRKIVVLESLDMPTPTFLEVLILKDFKSLSPELLILLDFKSLFPEVLILADFNPMRMRAIGRILEVLILVDFKSLVMRRSEMREEFACVPGGKTLPATALDGCVRREEGSPAVGEGRREEGFELNSANTE